MPEGIPYQGGPDNQGFANFGEWWKAVRGPTGVPPAPVDPGPAGGMNLVGDEMPIQGGITPPWQDPAIAEGIQGDLADEIGPIQSGPEGVPAPPIPPVTREPRLPPPHPAGPQPGALGPLGLTEQQQVDSDRSRARSRAEEAGIERGNVIRPTEGPGLDSQGIISMLLEFFQEQEARRARGLEANPEAFRRTEATGEFSGV